MLSYLILKILFTVIFIEAVTNIICKEDITERVRCAIHNTKWLAGLSSMIKCGRCTAFHVTWLTMAALALYPLIVQLLILIVGLWRFSNLLHHVFDLIKLKKFRKVD
jgi:hypothetical protein